MGNRISVGKAILAELSDLLADARLPFWMESEEHEAPGGGNCSCFMAGEVNVLAIVDDELLGGDGVSSCVLNSCLQY